MADYKTDYTINYSTNATQAEVEIASLREQVALLQEEVRKLQEASQTNSGFVISPEQAAATVERLGNIQVGLGNLNVAYTNIDQSTGLLNSSTAANVVIWDEIVQRIPHFIEYAKILGEIGIVVTGVATAFAKWKDIAALSASVVASTTALSSQVSEGLEKAGSMVTRFVSEYLKLGALSNAAKFAGEVVVLAQFAKASLDASEAVKEMTLSLGNLNKDFTDFDHNTVAIETAKQRYTSLEQASITLR